MAAFTNSRTFATSGCVGVARSRRADPSSLCTAARAIFSERMYSTWLSTSAISSGVPALGVSRAVTGLERLSM
ncbi:hypothetical protein [Methylobacterium radiotolerans]|uniref:hypothetical protein n=1 Tax=Methylobacterium radiotolerans TaxID=31998 RepID=UPI003396C8E0